MALQHSRSKGKRVLTSSVRSLIDRSTSAKPSINVLIIENHLFNCQNPKAFLQIHAQMAVSGFFKDTFVASRLLSIATNCLFLSLSYSLQLLHQIENPNAFIWNTVMRAYIQRNAPNCCLPVYRSMLQYDLVPDNYTYPILVRACALQFCVLQGKQIHAHILKFGFYWDVYVTNTLITMYSICGHLEDSRLSFDESPVLDSVSWNSILAAYVQINDVNEAVYLFDKMPKQNTISSNSMIVLFGRSKCVNDARKLFDSMTDRDNVTWTAMITCYVQNEMFGEALELFYLMKGCEILIDEVVMVCVLSACASLGAAKLGEVLHGLIIRTGFEAYVNLLNALIHMYSSCGNINVAQLLFVSGNHLDQISWNSIISGYLKCAFVDKARHYFDAMPQKDLVSWSIMISGYVQNECFSDALALFHEMLIRGVSPDATTLVSILSACANLSALEQGKWVHAYIRKHAFHLNVFLGTTLLDMYMKCGCTEAALDVFGEMIEKSISTWNSVILGLAVNGFFKEALEKFSDMKKHGVLPNEITFVVVLGACRHGGLVDEGREHFISMKQTYNLEPNVKHYGCMIDLLGRIGLLSEAEALLKNMPMAPDVSTWGALLGACRKHGNADIGERVGKNLIETTPQHDGFHVLLSHIYASKGMWDEFMDVRSMMKQKRALKMPGSSMIEANGIVHEFLSGDTNHH